MFLLLRVLSTISMFSKPKVIKVTSSFYTTFYFSALLALASQRADIIFLEWSGIEWFKDLVEHWKDHERGALPGIIEMMVVVYIASKFL